MATIQEIVERFQLSPLTGEGGLFRRTYCSTDVLEREAFQGKYPEAKNAGSAIVYMVTPHCYSRLHRLPTDEVYHFYLGDPVQLLLIPPEGEPRTVTLGQDVLSGMEVQFVVPALWWQGSCLKEGGQWALLGTTMAPAYGDRDYEDADPEALCSRHPDWAERIRFLTAPAVFPEAQTPEELP